MPAPYIIRVSSTKGGVGKTTIAVNLGVILSLSGYKTLIVDCDAANPTVGFHLGMDQANIGYRQVVTGRAGLESSIAMHGPTGLRVLPGIIGPYSFVPSEKQSQQFLRMLTATKYNFILLDTSPGFAFNEPFSYYTEALLVTIPEASSCTSAMRLAHAYTEQKLKHNLVINRVKNKKYEFSVEEIEDMYENRVIGVLPEDEIVPLSVSEHIPAYLINRRDSFSRSIRDLSRRYSSRLETVDVDGGARSGTGGIMAFIRRLLGLK